MELTVSDILFDIRDTLIEIKRVLIANQKQLEEHEKNHQKILEDQKALNRERAF